MTDYNCYNNLRTSAGRNKQSIDKNDEINIYIFKNRVKRS